MYTRTFGFQIKLTAMRESFKKVKSKVINYRSYEHFSNEVFRETLFGKLSQHAFVNNDYGFENFCNITLQTLDKYAFRGRQNILEAIKCPS